MKNDKTRLTVVALIALVIVCTGSFLGIKSINSKAAVTIPSSATAATTSAATTTGVPLITEVPTMPVATTVQKTTADADVTSETESTTVDNRFTTFANSLTSSSAADESSSAATSAATSATAPTTEKKTTAATTYNVSSKVDSLTATTTQEEADDLIEEAATFSEGFLGYLFDPKGNFFYTTSDPWQRHFGFNELYDVGASFIVFYYDTMRCKFTYDNKDWLI
ncbi:MAG: DUF4474 domain-containing protein, partial [Acutalibacteraceae bacterium]